VAMAVAVAVAVAWLTNVKGLAEEGESVLTGGCVGVTNTPHMRVLSVCDSIAHLQVQLHWFTSVGN